MSLTPKQRAIAMTEAGLSERAIAGILGITMADVQRLMVEANPVVELPGAVEVFELTDHVIPAGSIASDVYAVGELKVKPPFGVLIMNTIQLGALLPVGHNVVFGNASLGGAGASVFISGGNQFAINSAILPSTPGGVEADGSLIENFYPPDGLVDVVLSAYGPGGVPTAQAILVTQARASLLVF